MLRLEIPVISQQQDQDTNRQEGRPERLAEMAQRLGLFAVVRQRRVEPEELSDGDTDRGKRERRAEPREERPFWQPTGLAFRHAGTSHIRGCLTQRQVIPRDTPLILKLDALEIAQRLSPPALAL